MSQRLKVAVVMPVRNEEAEVKATLDAIFASTRLPDEIIAADGMSTDRTAERILEYRNRGVPIRVVENPTIFCGGGRNRAVEVTDADVILLADFGNRVDATWLENMVRPFEEDPALDIVGGMFRPRAETDFEHCMAAIHYFDDYVLEEMSPEERDRILPKNILPGGLTIGFTQKIWERVGGFPEWLAKGQDKLFSRKAVGAGAKVAVVWDAWLSHHMRENPRAVFKQLYGYGRGNGQMHYMSAHFLKLVAIYGLFLVLFAAGLVGHPSYAVIGVVAFIAYIWWAGVRKVMASRTRPFRLKYLLLVPLVLIPRDIGTILGHLVGWMEWFLAPRYRQLFNAYTADIRADSLKTIAR